MSLMAGFDLITELRNSLVRDLLVANLQLGGAAARPPFEITLPVSQAGLSGTIHIVVTDVTLDLATGQPMALALVFTGASLETAALNVCPLDGTITIHVPPTIVVTAAKASLALNLAGATVELTLSAASTTIVSDELAGKPVTPAAFLAAAQQVLTAYVHGLGQLSVPLGIAISPSGGSLSPMSFASLEAHCIGPAGHPGQQALGLFGLLAANAHGTPDQKTTTVTTATREIAVSVSAHAFHSFIFCPGIAHAFGVAVGALPTSCGNASGVDLQGVTLKSLTDTFQTGSVALDLSFAKSGPCYDASGSAHGAITFTISQGKLTPHIAMGQPHVDVDIPWYCWLAAGVVLGPLGLALAGAAESIGTSIAQKLADSALAGALGSTLPGQKIGGLSGPLSPSFFDVDVVPEGLTILGIAGVGSPWIPGPSVDLVGSVTVASKTLLGSGVLHTTIFCETKPDDFPWTLTSQAEAGTYALVGHLAPRPLLATFKLIGNNQTVTLDQPSGTVVLHDIHATFPTASPPGGMTILSDVHIDYVVSGTTVTLHNRPEEGNFSIDLEGHYTDCRGHAIPGLSGETSTQVLFEGQNLAIGNNYAARVAACWAAIMKYFQDHVPTASDTTVPSTPWVPVNYPAPDTVIDQIQAIMMSGLASADVILNQTVLAHGFSMTRALASQTTTVGPSAARVAVAQHQADSVSALVATVRGLTEQVNALGAVAGGGQKARFRVKAVSVRE